MPFGLGKSEKRPEGDPAPEETAAGSEDAPTAFRPTFLDDAESAEGAPVRPQSTPPPEGDAFFISVSQDGGAEIHRFDDPFEAKSFVEELLEKGVPEEGVVAFSGRKLALRIANRPVVKLAAGRED